MKRVISLFLVFCTVISIFGCGAKPSDEGTPQSGGEKDITLMVYMVGSDLEAKGGAGSDDLSEMAESGVDLSRVNVLVYAGGSKKWHNDTVSADDGHTLLALGENGFEKKQTYEGSSMGGSEPLARFLKYAHESYPAKEFALVMWDHGDGPLIGYGKDMLFDNDSLTLNEMRAALEASPFGADNKLSWIGFDACLMSSAELAVTLGGFASYLVASQEIEPAFGWNYSFLSDLGNKGTEEMLSSLCRGYLKDCEKYYERKGFEGRDTTLSLMDLSVAGELEGAMCDLFSSVDVNKNYNDLTKRRVESRALGRASTGSEYDLVDLWDLADKMSSAYGEKAERVKNAVRKMVKANAANADDLCGISVYYPFYNKSYYERSWGDVYAELGVLSEYAEYMDSYSKIWLGGNYVEENASSETPEDDGKNKYSLTLTDEQAETYADASYYILMREGDELYTKIYSAGNVEKNGNKLTAHFDGDVLYARDGLGKYMLPVTEEHDTVGDNTRYSVYVNLSNETPIIGDKPDGYKHKTGGYRFHLAANSKTKEISTSALVPYNASVDAASLAGGKLEDADTSEYSVYYFIQERHRYLERYENGAIKPVDDWKESTYVSAYTSRIEDGLDFVFESLPEGEFVLIFEIEDTQGSKYCSEMIPVKAELKNPESTEIEYHDISWRGGDKALLLDKNGVELYLTTKESYGKVEYVLEAKNKNDYKIAVLGHELMYNEKVYCADGSFGYFSVGPGETASDKYGFSFGDAADLELIDELRSIELLLSVVAYTGEKTVIPRTEFSVKLSPETSFIPAPSPLSEGYYDNNVATRDVLAEKQKVAVRDGLELTLISLGGKGDENGKLVATYMIENKSDTLKYIVLEGITFDGIHIAEGSGPIGVPAGATVFKALVYDEETLDAFMISSPKSVSVQVRHLKYDTLEGGGGFADSRRYELELSEKGSGCTFKAGSETLMNENGIRLALKELVVPDESYVPYSWYVTVENHSGDDISVVINNLKINGKSADLDSMDCPVTYRYGKAEDGDNTVFVITCSKSAGRKVELTFDFDICDFTKEKLLWSSSESVSLTAKK